MRMVSLQLFASVHADGAARSRVAAVLRRRLVVGLAFCVAALMALPAALQASEAEDAEAKAKVELRVRIIDQPVA
ncbi:MAG: hypothetical protein ACXIU7_05125 [Roseinatronobacter sp.]